MTRGVCAVLVTGVFGAVVALAGPRLWLRIRGYFWGEEEEQDTGLDWIGFSFWPSQAQGFGCMP